MLSVIILTFIYSTQSEDFEDMLNEYIKDISSDAALIIDMSEIQQKYEYYKDNPVNINNTTQNELIKLPLISQNTAIILMNHSPFKTQSDFRQFVSKNIKKEIIREILLNCISVEEIEEIKFNMNYRVRNQSVLQEKRGFKENIYKGDELDLYQRFDMDYSNFSANAIVNKDAGEVNINEFQSFSTAYDTKDITFIVGGYNLAYGLGNLYDMSFLSLKNADFINGATEFGYGGTVNRSTIENNFFRGLFGAYNFDIGESDLRISSFYSDINRPANIDEDFGYVSSIYKAGKYRTENEIRKKDNLNEKLYGANIEFNSYNFGIGALTSYLKYDKDIVTSSFSTFLGREGLLSSLYGYLIFSDHKFMFESSIDANEANSHRVNYTYTKDDLEFLSEFRYTDADYRAPYASNFGEQSFLANEKGLLSGIDFSYKDSDISIFADIYSSHYKTFTNTKPLRGLELYSDIKTKLNGVDLSFRFSHETKSRAVTLDIYDAKITIPSEKLKGRVDISEYLGKGIYYNSRLEIVSFKNEFEKQRLGWMTFFELKHKVNSLGLYYGLRYSIFNTDDFFSSIYAYQYQVPGLAYVYALYNKGNQINAFVRYRPIDLITFWLRIDHLLKNSGEQIGSSYEIVPGSERTNMFFQLDFSL